MFKYIVLTVNEVSDALRTGIHLALYGFREFCPRQYTQHIWLFVFLYKFALFYVKVLFRCIPGTVAVNITIIKPILIRVYKRGWPDLPQQQSPILHLAQFIAPFSPKPTLLLSFSTCIFHVFFGRPGFLLPLGSLQTTTLSSERAHHPSSKQARTISLHSPLPSEPISFNPKISIRSSVLFFSDSFAPHIASYHCSLCPS